MMLMLTPNKGEYFVGGLEYFEQDSNFQYLKLSLEQHFCQFNFQTSMMMLLYN